MNAPILLVDDDPDDLFALQAALEPLALEIVTAGAADEALRRLHEREFALVITDLRLPAVNGLELCALIRERERCRDMPVIILTGYDEDGAKALPGYRAGSFEFMRKPVEPEELRRRVALRAARFRRGSENR